MDAASTWDPLPGLLTSSTFKLFGNRIYLYCLESRSGLIKDSSGVSICVYAVEEDEEETSLVDDSSVVVAVCFRVEQELLLCRFLLEIFRELYENGPSLKSPPPPLNRDKDEVEKAAGTDDETIRRFFHRQEFLAARAFELSERVLPNKEAAATDLCLTEKAVADLLLLLLVNRTKDRDRKVLQLGGRSVDRNDDAMMFVSLWVMILPGRAPIYLNLQSLLNTDLFLSRKGRIGCSASLFMYHT